MPPHGNSGDSNDLATRYGHLLQPIRDLTKNWDIDVAAQLEEYLAEIERIKISFDGGKTSMNFAEAALLIQGSACIYSKKVEYLYTLVYQTLDLIASKKRLQQASSVDDQGKDKDASFRDDIEEFLPLDDIKEAKNIDLKEDENDFQRKSSQIVPRTPLALLPLGEKDKEDVLLSRTGEVLGRRNDFKMNTCIIHASGALLLDMTHLSLLDSSFTQVMNPAPLAPQDPQPAHEQQPANQVVVDDANLEPVDLPCAEFDSHFDTPELMDDNVFPENVGDQGNENGENAAENELDGHEERRAMRARGATQPEQVNNLPSKDHWKMLDPHEPDVSKNKPFKKAIVFISKANKFPPKPAKKRKVRETQNQTFSLETIFNQEARVIYSVNATSSGKPFKKPLSLVQQSKKKRKRHEEKKEPFLIPIHQFITQAFYSHASKMLKNPLKTPSFPEFEYLYWIEFRRQQKVQAKQKKILSQVATDEEIEEIEELKSITVKPGEDDDAVVEDERAGSDFDDDDFGGGGEDNFCLGDGDAPTPVEPMDDPADGLVISSYEELVRKHVDGYLLEAQQYAQETDLSRRVQDWEERIVPVLSKEETHRPFDIHKYGEEIMSSFKGKSNQTFKEMARGKEAFEICRLFLATLQLANNYNVQITADGVGEKAIDTMNLQLIKTTPGNQAIATFKGHASL